jgi:hypothetical protein
MEIMKDENISDELLAAFLDGNTTREETELVLEAMTFDSGLISAMDLGNDTIDYMKTYGQEKNYALDPFDQNIYQGQQPTCAVRSQEIILRDYGIVVPQEELAGFAEANGWYDSDPLTGGTPSNCIGNLLEVYGIHTTQSDNNTIIELANELSAGHRVIVSIDANELWAKTWLEKEWCKIEDMFQQGGNHALIVAGVEVNPNDLNASKVVLTDPGTGNLRIEYDWRDYLEAWKDSNCMMVATTTPAPYQYNAEMQQMEYSQFATDFMADNQFGYMNDFNIHFPALDYAAYNPYYMDGHLDYIGGMDYDTFQEHWLNDDHFDMSMFDVPYSDDFTNHSFNDTIFDNDGLM